MDVAPPASPSRGRVRHTCDHKVTRTKNSAPLLTTTLFLGNFISSVRYVSLPEFFLRVSQRVTRCRAHPRSPLQHSSWPASALQQCRVSPSRLQPSPRAPPLLFATSPLPAMALEEFTGCLVCRPWFCSAVPGGGYYLQLQLLVTVFSYVCVIRK